MGRNDYDSVARRWVDRCLGSTRESLSNPRMLDSGDQIFSYGSHFEIARILRDRKGEPVAWLLNGDTWGPTTSRHQAFVRNAVRGGLPTVTIPHSALEAASIDLSSVQIIDVQSDWWTERTLTTENVRREQWDVYDDRGGWQNTRTGEIVMRKDYGTPKPRTECDCGIDFTPPGPWKTGWNWELQTIEQRAREAHMRARHGVWEEFPASRRKSGRISFFSGKHVEWDAVDDPTHPRGYRFERIVRRHWLGGSLIRAAVTYQGTQRCASCSGSGQASEPWFTSLGSPAIGPLDREQMGLAEAQNDYRMERNGGIRPPLNWDYMIEGYAEHRECRACSGRGRTRVARRRWAYFLSGFDENETRPSYFFCELPPKARPETVEQALEALKPDAVRLAEQDGREVTRQGDIFAIPMPGLTLRELKKQGGVHIRKPKLVQVDPEGQPGSPMRWTGPRPRLLETNHEATEIVTVGGLVYARGTLRHVPEFRRPDHRLARMGDGKTWHLIMKNTVPVSS